MLSFLFLFFFFVSFTTIQTFEIILSIPFMRKRKNIKLYYRFQLRNIFFTFFLLKFNRKKSILKIFFAQLLEDI